MRRNSAIGWLKGRSLSLSSILGISGADFTVPGLSLLKNCSDIITFFLSLIYSYYKKKAGYSPPRVLLAQHTIGNPQNILNSRHIFQSNHSAFILKTSN